MRNLCSQQFEKFARLCTQRRAYFIRESLRVNELDRGKFTPDNDINYAMYNLLYVFLSYMRSIHMESILDHLRIFTR